MGKTAEIHTIGINGIQQIVEVQLNYYGQPSKVIITQADTGVSDVVFDSSEATTDVSNPPKKAELTDRLNKMGDK